MQEQRTRVSRDRIVRAALAAVVLFGCALLPAAGRAQTASTQCTLSIEPMGSGSTGGVMVNASGCDGDVAIIAKAGSNQKQFPAGSGPEIYQPFTVSPCDLGITGDKAISVTYTAVVVNGTNKGKTSAVYSGTIQPPPKPDDSPPSVSMYGRPSPGTYVRPGDIITLTVLARDDIGLTAVKVLDPSGKIIFDKRITPVPPPPAGCHVRSPGQSESLSIPTPYTVPSDPPTPSLRFTAMARDTAGQETTAVAEYWTETVWTGRMILAGSSSAGGAICTTTWSIELFVKVSPGEAVSGSAEARHTPIKGCRFRGSEEPLITFEITGTTDGKTFRLLLKPTGGAGIAWGVGALHLLMLPSPMLIELTRTNEKLAEGSLGRDNSGNVEGKGATASIAGTLNLTCCFSDPGPPEPAKRAPTFLGEGDK